MPVSNSNQAFFHFQLMFSSLTRKYQVFRNDKFRISRDFHCPTWILHLPSAKSPTLLRDCCSCGVAGLTKSSKAAFWVMLMETSKKWADLHSNSTSPRWSLLPPLFQKITFVCISFFAIATPGHFEPSVFRVTAIKSHSQLMGWFI